MTPFTLDKLKPLLEKHKIPQFAAAAKLGIAGPTLTNYLAGNCSIPARIKTNLEKLITYLETKPLPEPYFKGLELD